MNKIIKKVATKFIIMLIICFLLGIMFTAFVPIMNNNMALTQMENSDALFLAQQAWIRIQNVFYLMEIAIIAFYIGSMGIDIFKYVKNKKENI